MCWSKLACCSQWNRFCKNENDEITIFLYFYVYLMTSCQKGLSSIINKTSKILTKRPPVATTVPSGTHHGHWYTGVYIQIYDPGLSNPTFLGFCSPRDYRQSLQSSMGVLTFNSTEDCILRLWRNEVWYLMKSIPLAAEFIYLATSVECGDPINWPTAVKGLVQLP